MTEEPSPQQLHDVAARCVSLMSHMCLGPGCRISLVAGYDSCFELPLSRTITPDSIVTYLQAAFLCRDQDYWHNRGFLYVPPLTAGQKKKVPVTLILRQRQTLVGETPCPQWPNVRQQFCVSSRFVLHGLRFTMRESVLPSATAALQPRNEVIVQVSVPWADGDYFEESGSEHIPINQSSTWPSGVIAVGFVVIICMMTIGIHCMHTPTHHKFKEHFCLLA